MDRVKLPASILESAAIRKNHLLESIPDAASPLFSDPILSSDLERVLAFSEFIASAAARETELLPDLITSGDLNHRYPADKYKKLLDREVSDETTLKNLLTRTRMREMVRIAWRDITLKADLEETVKDLSCLASACVDKAFSFLYDKLRFMYGTPLDKHGQEQNIIVLGMGKLGADELNFSSDIDLIFAYPENGPVKGGGGRTSEEFFTKLCRNFLRVFSAATNNATLFRVDTRLRPYGDSGPLVMSCAAMEAYYQTQGREWERYALIKARPIAGDIGSGSTLLKHLNPFIYRRYFDYGSFDSFRDMKRRISLQVKDKRLQNNIKLGAGGIREIEFFGQLFQLIRGGVEPEFQEREILKVLNILEKRKYISAATCRELSRAYCFLRQVEHRLQEYQDRQTHDLPSTDKERLRLAISMDFKNWEAFSGQLDSHMKTVHGHFRQLLVTEKDDSGNGNSEALKYLWLTLNDPQALEARSRVPGFEDQNRVVTILKSLESHPNTKKLTSQGRKRLDRLIPGLIRTAGRQKQPETVLGRLVDLIITIQRRTCYLSLLLENPIVLKHLADLAARSPWITSFLSQHPALLDELLDPATLYSPPDKEDMERELDRRMAQIPEDDFEFQLEELCIFKQINTLRIAVADVSGNFPLMKVSDRLTFLAETILDRTIDICRQTIQKKYGTPSGQNSAACSSPGFAAVAYGKLGGIELGYTSDLDLVFIHAGGTGFTQGGPKSIENNRFYTLLSQRIIHALTLHTPAGTLYETDMRLRPRGQGGMIVSHIEAFKEYILQEAWTWEHQAIVRARPVSGDPALRNRFNKARKKALTIKRDPEQLKQEVLDMRRRMRKELLKPEKEVFDLKQERGGIVDIEFIVQFLVLKNSRSHPNLTDWTDNVRLLETLAAEKILGEEETQTLKSAYLTLRHNLHRRSLREKGKKADADLFISVQETVCGIFDKVFHNQ